MSIGKLGKSNKSHRHLVYYVVHNFMITRKEDVRLVYYDNKKDQLCKPGLYWVHCRQQQKKSTVVKSCVQSTGIEPESELTFNLYCKSFWLIRFKVLRTTNEYWFYYVMTPHYPALPSYVTVVHTSSSYRNWTCLSALRARRANHCTNKP